MQVAQEKVAHLTKENRKLAEELIKAKVNADVYLQEADNTKKELEIAGKELERKQRQHETNINILSKKAETKEKESNERYEHMKLALITKDRLIGNLCLQLSSLLINTAGTKKY